MAGYSEAKKKANKAWDSKNLDRISVAMPKGSKAALKANAERTGESVNAFINRAVMEVTETENIHRAYQRMLLRHLESVGEALERNDISGAKGLLAGLISDTQKDIAG